MTEMLITIPTSDVLNKMHYSSVGVIKVQAQGYNKHIYKATIFEIMVILGGIYEGKLI